MLLLFYYRIMLATLRFLARHSGHTPLGKGAIWLLTKEATEEKPSARPLKIV